MMLFLISFSCVGLSISVGNCMQISQSAYGAHLIGCLFFTNQETRMKTAEGPPGEKNQQLNWFPNQGGEDLKRNRKFHRCFIQFNRPNLHLTIRFYWLIKWTHHESLWICIEFLWSCRINSNQTPAFHQDFDWLWLKMIFSFWKCSFISNENEKENNEISVIRLKCVTINWPTASVESVRNELIALFIQKDAHDPMPAASTEKSTHRERSIITKMDDWDNGCELRHYLMVAMGFLVNAPTPCSPSKWNRFVWEICLIFYGGLLWSPWISEANHLIIENILENSNDSKNFN